MGQGELETVPIGLEAQTVLVPTTAHVVEHRQSEAIDVELLRRGKRRTILRISAVPRTKPETRQGQKNNVVILHAPGSIAKMISCRDRQSRAVICIQAPGH